MYSARPPGEVNIDVWNDIPSPVLLRVIDTSMLYKIAAILYIHVLRLNPKKYNLITKSLQQTPTPLLSVSIRSLFLNLPTGSQSELHHSRSQPHAGLISQSQRVIAPCGIDQQIRAGHSPGGCGWSANHSVSVRERHTECTFAIPSGLETSRMKNTLKVGRICSCILGHAICIEYGNTHIHIP